MGLNLSSFFSVSNFQPTFLLPISIQVPVHNNDDSPVSVEIKATKAC